MSVYDDFIAALRAYADASGDPTLRRAFGTPGSRVLVDGISRPTGAAWVAPSTVDGLISALSASVESVSAGGFDLYVDAGAGDDANDGRTASTPVQTWQRLTELWPRAYMDAGTVNLLGTTALVIPDGPCTLPAPVGATQPVHFVGSWAQDPSGGGGGTRTIAGGGVGANTITDSAGGLTADAYAGFRLRFTGGSASGTSYTIQTNTATVVTLAHAFENGATPAPGDTFVMEYGAVPLYFNDLQLAAPGPVVFEGVYFNGVGSGSTRRGAPAVHILQLTGGPFYVPNVRINTQSGRLWLVDGSLRSYDITEWYHVDPYPDLIGGFYGFFVCTGDVAPSAGSNVMGCLVGRYIDPVATQGGVFDLIDSDLLVVNQNDYEEGCIGRYTTTTDNASRIRSVTGVPLNFCRGSHGYVQGVSLEGSEQGLHVHDGADVRVEGLTGTVNTGWAVQVYDAGRLLVGDDNTADGPSGEVLVDATDVLWSNIIPGTPAVGSNGSIAVALTGT